MKNIKITKTEDIDYIQFNKLLEFDEIFHAYILKSHNIGFGKFGVFENILPSYHKFENRFKIDRNCIFHPYQNHTYNIFNFNNQKFISNSEINKAFVINNQESEPEKFYEFDGVITDKEKIATLLTEADCIPLLLYDPKNKVIGNIHSGWKGTVNKIGIKSIEMMKKEYNSRPENIICCLGPCIHKDHFLVNNDVVNLYLNSFEYECKNYNIIEDTDLCNEKGIQYRIDNILLYRLIMKQLGLLDKNIIDSEVCTVCNSNICHSRRCEGENFNTSATIMMLK